VARVDRRFEAVAVSADWQADLLGEDPFENDR
jgi:hypothetical protein